MADEQHGCEIISRKEAIERGLKRYFTGKPCRYGHISERHVLRTRCMECVREQQARWRSENTSLSRERQRKSYRKHWHRRREDNKKWVSNNRERVRSKNNERARKYPDKVKNDRKRFYASNPGINGVYCRNRKARKIGNGGSHAVSDIREIFKLQRGKCAHCKISLTKAKQHVDHIVPLVRGGRNDRANLQFLCEPCNLRKGARDQIDIMRSMGRLL